MRGEIDIRTYESNIAQETQPLCRLDRLLSMDRVLVGQLIWPKARCAWRLAGKPFLAKIDPCGPCRSAQRRRQSLRRPVRRSKSPSLKKTAP